MSRREAPADRRMCEIRVVPIRASRWKTAYTTPSQNVTDDDPHITAKIALAHLNEFPDYYTPGATRGRSQARLGAAPVNARPPSMEGG